MASCFFTNLDALRLALASGIVPVELSRRPVSAAVGQPSGWWIETPESPDKDTVAALAHIGVKLFAAPADQLKPLPCWAAALPVKPRPDDSENGPALFELPTRRLAGFLAELARSDSAVERWRIFGEFAIVSVPQPPVYWLISAPEWLVAFRPALGPVWVRSGWQHPHPVAAHDEIVLVDADSSWRFLEPGTWNSRRDDAAIRPVPVHRALRVTPTPLAVELRWKPNRAGNDAAIFWLWKCSAGELRDFLAAVEPPVLHELEAIRMPDGVAFRLRSRTPAELHWAGPGSAYALARGYHRLAIPVDRELAPRLRAAAMARAWALQDDEWAWIDEYRALHRIADAAFLPLRHWLRHAAPAPVSLRAEVIPHSPFQLASFVVLPEPTTVVVESTRLNPSSSSSTGVLPSSGNRPSRMRRWINKFLAPVEATTDAESEIAMGEPPSERRPVQLQRDRLARRTELEKELFRSADRFGAEALAERWAELAGLYTESGNAADAGLAWLHAIWHAPKIPEPWWPLWDRLESRSRPPRDRVVSWIRNAAAPAHLRRPIPAGEWAGIVRDVESAEGNWPCRMVWLAWSALARLSGDDALLLARARDRLWIRLRNEAALASSDTPSFLRFQALAGSDRFSLARDWLIRGREPVQRWIRQHPSADRSVAAGIGADLDTTAAYAEYLFAWGFAKLGERTRAEELVAGAAEIFERARRDEGDSAVALQLRSLWEREIAAASGFDRSVEIATGEAALPEIGRYAIRKLQNHSQILGRRGAPSEFASKPLQAWLGCDPIGRQLKDLLETADAPTPDTVATLLEIAARDPTARTAPRILLTLLEVAPDPVAWLARVAPALELLPESLRLQNIVDGYGGPILVRAGSRAIELVCRRSLSASSTDGLKLLSRTLLRAVDQNDPPTRDMIRLAAAEWFRTLARLGLADEVERWLTRWPRLGEGTTESALAAAMGWFRVGDRERGNRILNEARERLFVSGIPSERERTRVALAYARALAHAPPRWALGRYEELFQRLGPVALDGGTGRFFALKILELIDAAICGIVNDDFSFGPEIRDWLDRDEGRLRQRIVRDLESALE